MAELPSAFNESEHEDMNDYSCLPKGKYAAQIVKSEIVLTKKAKKENNPKLGQMLKLQWKVISGKYKGKYVFTQINLVNPNPQAVEIGGKELSTIVRACSLSGAIQDSQELHGIPCIITVDIEESENYPDKNVIRMYEKATEDMLQSAASGSETKDDGNDDVKPKKKRVWDE